jgi:predicted nuclease of predicted toxin-antitoxin system
LIRVLLDQGLPHSALPFLRAAGWDVVHVIDIGMDRASDVDIIARARADNRVVCTLDADFHALLSLSGDSKPSVVRIRQEGLRAKELADLLLSAWPRVADAIDTGAMVTITDRAIRIRRLPVGKSE